MNSELRIALFKDKIIINILIKITKEDPQIFHQE